MYWIKNGAQTGTITGLTSDWQRLIISLIFLDMITAFIADYLSFHGRIMLYLNDCNNRRKHCQEIAACVVKNHLLKFSLEDASVDFLIKYAFLPLSMSLIFWDLPLVIILHVWWFTICLIRIFILIVAVIIGKWYHQLNFKWNLVSIFFPSTKFFFKQVCADYLICQENVDSWFGC